MLSAGMSDTVPAWKFPAPVPEISKTPSEASALAVNASGNFLYSLVSAGIIMVCRSFAPAPQISEILTLLPGVPRR